MNLLTDLIPAKARKYVYAVLAVLSAAYGIWRASEGDWEQFAASLIASAVTALAHANTTPSAPSDDDIAQPLGDAEEGDAE